MAKIYKITRRIRIPGGGGSNPTPTPVTPPVITPPTGVYRQYAVFLRGF